MTGTTQSLGESRHDNSPANILVVGDDIDLPDAIDVTTEHSFDVETAHFLLPDDGELADTVQTLADLESNSHTAAQMNAPPTPGFALPFADKAIILEEASDAHHSGMQKHAEWVDKAIQLLGEDSVYSATFR
jgi:hypothetical protein